MGPHKPQPTLTAYHTVRLDGLTSLSPLFVTPQRSATIAVGPPEISMSTSPRDVLTLVIGSTQKRTDWAEIARVSAALPAHAHAQSATESVAYI